MEGRILLGDRPGIDELLRPFEDLDDAGILERERARPQFAVILLAELAQQSLAEDIGALGIRVEEPSAFPAALAQALAANRPAVIDVVTDIEALAPTAVA